MSCSCIAKHYSVTIKSTDCKTLVYEDNSTWMTGNTFDGIPQEMDVEIETPGGHTSTVKVNPNKSNHLSSIEIFGDTSKRCLKDGIYCFRVNSCDLPYKISLTYTCNAQCKIDTILAKAKTYYDKEEAYRLQRMLDTLKSASEKGQINTAKNLLDILNTSLSNENCESC